MPCRYLCEELNQSNNPKHTKGQKACSANGSEGDIILFYYSGRIPDRSIRTLPVYADTHLCHVHYRTDYRSLLQEQVETGLEPDADSWLIFVDSRCDQDHLLRSLVG